MKDICFQMGVMPTAIYRLEKGSNNFEMGNMMSYIKALQHILVIENGQHSYRTNDAQELGSILALIRKEKAMGLLVNFYESIYISCYCKICSLGMTPVHCG